MRIDIIDGCVIISIWDIISISEIMSRDCGYILSAANSRHVGRNRKGKSRRGR